MGKTKMKLESRYIISAISITIGCVILYRTGISPLVPLYFCLPSIFIGRIKRKRPKSIANFFFEGAVYVLGITILIILVSQIPGEKLNELTRKWYFVGLLWLFCLSGLSYGYLKEKERTQEPCLVHRKDRNGR